MPTEFGLENFADGNPLIYAIGNIPLYNKFNEDSFDEEEMSIVDFFKFILEKSRDKTSWIEIQDIVDGKADWALTELHSGPSWWEDPDFRFDDGDFMPNSAFYPMYPPTTTVFDEVDSLHDETHWDDDAFASPADSGFASDIEVPTDLIEKTFCTVFEQAEVSERITRLLLDVLDEKNDPPKPLKYKNFAARCLMKKTFATTFSPFVLTQSFWKPRSYDLHETFRQACLYRPFDHPQNHNQPHLVQRMRSNRSPVMLEPNQTKPVPPHISPLMHNDMVYFYTLISPIPPRMIS